MKKLVLLFIFLIFPFYVYADDITSKSKIYINENINTKITDNNENSFIKISANETIKILSDEDIYKVYIVYEYESKNGIISNDQKSYNIGENNFLHEYINVEETIGKSKELTLKYNEDVKIAEIYMIDNGDIPEYVEIWNPPVDKADLLLLSTHSDDEQLFFLGLLPTYVAKGASVQVIYFANHYDNPKRLHEQLHGLYTVGIRNYPIIGIVPDAYSESLDGAIRNLESATLTLDDTIDFQVEMIRKFKPLVVVGHDELGEYSHGQHILNTHVLKIALEKTNDKTYHQESFEKYGAWDVPKTYLHLYKENQITMNYDIPLEYFDGKTAYEVSKEGYSKHLSQQWTWFTKWINGSNNSYTKATDIKTYKPTDFGLYRTTVGNDIEKNDMFENLTFRKDEIKEETHINNTTTDTTEDLKEKINEFDINKLLAYKEYIIIGIVFIIIILILKPKKNKVKK